MLTDAIVILVIAQQQAFANLVHGYLEVALLTISFYDYLLCFGDEIHLMWRQPFRISTAMYFPIRYFPVAKILFLVIVVGSLPRHCTGIYQFVEFLGVIARAGILATLCARTYALRNRASKIPVYILISISTIAVILGFVEVFETECKPSDPRVFIGSATWGLIVSITRLVAEGFGIVLTFYYGRSDYRPSQSRSCLMWFTNGSLSSFILRSGVIYFMTTFTLELLSIVFNLDILGPSLRWFGGVTNALPLPIPAILVSRFLLKLRHKSVHGRRARCSPEEMSLSFVNGIETRLHLRMDDFEGTTLYDEQQCDNACAESSRASSDHSRKSEQYEMLKMDLQVDPDVMRFKKDISTDIDTPV